MRDVTRFTDVPSPSLVDTETGEPTGWHLCPAVGDQMCIATSMAPLDRRTATYRLDLVQPDGSTAVAQAVTVVNEGWVGSVYVSASRSPTSTDAWVDLTSHTTPIAASPRYSVSLYDQAGFRQPYLSTQCPNSTASPTCKWSVSVPTSGQTYTAYVHSGPAPDYHPPTGGVRAVGTISFTGFSVDSPPEESHTYDGIDVGLIAASTSQVSDEEITAEICSQPSATHQMSSSVCDQGLAWQAGVQASGGAGRKAALVALATGGGGGTAATLWYLWNRYVNAPAGAPSPPAVPAFPVPAPGTPGAPAITQGPSPAGGDPYIDHLTTQYMQRETLDGVALNFADAQWLARNCVAWETSVRSIGVLTGVNRACENMPVYAPGNDYPNATAFAMDSVREYPPWFTLNYEPARSSQSTPWYNRAAYSPNACTGRTGPMQCHEWPWAATHQGGDPSVYAPPKASNLMQLQGTENAGEGGKYSGFLGRPCDLRGRYATGRWGNTPFLALPQMHRPTFAVCGPGGSS